MKLFRLLPILCLTVGLAACGSPRQVTTANWGKGPAPQAKTAEPAPAPKAAAPAQPAPKVAEKVPEQAPEPAKPQMKAPEQAALPPPLPPGERTIQSLKGHSADRVRASLGEPSMMRRDGPAQVWQYYGSGCVLDLFLYDDKAGANVSHAVMRGYGPGQPADPDCAEKILSGKGAES